MKNYRLLRFATIWLLWFCSFYWEEDGRQGWDNYRDLFVSWDWLTLVIWPLYFWAIIEALLFGGKKLWHLIAVAKRKLKGVEK
jgi:hypothetical protein